MNALLTRTVPELNSLLTFSSNPNVGYFGTQLQSMLSLDPITRSLNS